MTEIKHLRIYGLVQGVGFRAEMMAQALELGLTGWVRNRFDGSVEAMIQGDERAVRSIIAWSQHGPRSARVTRVDVGEGTGDFAEFSARPTI